VRQEPPPTRLASRLRPARIAGAAIAAPAMNVALGSRASHPVIFGAALATTGLVCQRDGHVSAERWPVCFCRMGALKVWPDRVAVGCTRSAAEDRRGGPAVGDSHRFSRIIRKCSE
jgi:hypothetical protein